MATYAYDNFSIEFGKRNDGKYDLTAVSPDGETHHTTFVVPMSMSELQEAIVAMALDRSRAVDVLDRTSPLGVAEVHSDDDPISREMPPALLGVAPDDAAVKAEKLGAALAGALFGGGLGEVYDAARHASAVNQRGLRLTLRLDQVPALMSLPWEFLYRRPRFIASQRHTPLVRCLRIGELPAPPTITSTVRILGVVSSPSDLNALDVEAEQDNVEKAVAEMVEAGRVELDWLSPATPGGLRKALRDNEYHIIHYVGHSRFIEGHEGAIFLEDDAGRSRAVDGTMLANLLADQSSLRLVVLNSCDGARTTLSDPYAGVATTLMHLGVPAVVAMQFEITDQAAILFAEELYTNLIGRQDPIDAAVGEARKAIYIEVDRIEWATPVLFVRDPDVRLFNFKLPEVSMELPPPPALLAEDESLLRELVMRPEPKDDVPDEPGNGDVTINGVPPRLRPRRWPKRWRVALALAVALLTGGVIWNAQGPEGPEPRENSGHLSVQIRERDGDVHLYPIDADTLQPIDKSTSRGVRVLTDKGGATDTEGVWGFDTNRVAFVREHDDSSKDGGISYVVLGESDKDGGKKVAELIPEVSDSLYALPSWTADGSLFYLRADGCTPGPGSGCQQQLHHATFDEVDDGNGFLDDLSVDSESERNSDTGARFESVSAIASDPQDGSRVALVDVHGLWLANMSGEVGLLASGVESHGLAFTSDGRFIVTIEQNDNARDLTVRSASNGRIVASDALLSDSNSDRSLISLTADVDNELLVLSIVGGDASTSRITRLSVAGDGGITVIDERQLQVSQLGTPEAIAL